jgi:hypothetical protein
MNYRRYQIHFILAFLAIIFFACIFLFLYYIPARASLLYGPPANHLSISDRIDYSSRLLMHGDELLTPLNPNGVEQSFLVEPGESVNSIANRLEGFGFILSFIPALTSPFNPVISRSALRNLLLTLLGRFKNFLREMLRL